MTAYVEWVLGAARAITAPYVVTELDEATGALFARNAWTTRLRGSRRVPRPLGKPDGWTGDRGEVLGRNGTLDHPEALERGERLSGRLGGGLDPCGALQTTLLLAAGASAEVVVFLGQGASVDEARAVVQRYRAADLDGVLHAVTTRWDDVLAAVQVKTPDRSFDLMLNRWLLYQTLACRVWARAGFYQASGAYGFRDQLQDVMALTVAARDIARAHLLPGRGAPVSPRATCSTGGIRPRGAACGRASPTTGSGSPSRRRTTWRSPGTRTVLDEQIPFIEGPVLADDSLEAYFEPTVSAQRASLFEHCARALDRSLAVGSHGLPLMGTGDWNDGMNRVGAKGRGESVWLGLVPARDARGVGADRRERAARPSARARGAPTSRHSAERSRPRAGTATGIGERTSTTARRSAPPRTRSAASTRSRSRGPCSRAPPIPTAPRAP